MKIRMVIEKQHRKELVKLTAERLESESRYLGPPTMAYKVGGLTFNKDCTVDFDEGTDADALIEILNEQCIAFEWVDNEEPMETDRLSISIPADILDEAAMENLNKIIESKQGLFKKAFGTESLEIKEENDTLAFPWFDLSDTDEAMAYGHFIAKLTDFAKEAKRVTAKEKEVESEKYAMRCFLLRLGFKGEEFKADRKILLKNLDGPAAFPTQAAADEFAAQQKAKKEVQA